MYKARTRLQNIQKIIAKKIELYNDFTVPISTVAGIDLAYIGDQAITACVVTAFPSLQAAWSKTALTELHFPYIPTFLGFREGPPIIKMIRSMTIEVDLFFLNAHGIAHPLFGGCASHVGVVTKRPVIGVTAQNLCGTYDKEPTTVGEAVPMFISERQVGWILKSQKQSNPVYISPGHKTNIDSCLTLVQKCIRNHKFPEPLWLAHTIANREKQKLLGK